MRYGRSTLLLWIAGAFGLGCVRASEVVQGAEGDGSTATTTTTGGAATTEADSTSTTMSSTGARDPTSTDDGAEAGFIDVADVGSSDCDIWAQDCPTGSKCGPVATDGGEFWNATRCVPIADDPKSPGEVCTVVGSYASGIDDCVRGAMCLDVDRTTLTGRCIAMCTGAEQNPLCADPCAQCRIPADGFPTTCRVACDPLAQDCQPGEACYVVDGSFACFADVSGDAGAAGDSCSFDNACAQGSFCAATARVPGCAGDTGCCAPYCDTTGMDECDAVLPGTTCVPLFEVGEVSDSCIASGESVGACLLPLER